MSKETLRKKYFLWLANRITNKNCEDSEYIFLLKTLFEKEFYWTIENDGNRAEEGKLLRSYFCSDNDLKDIPDTINGPCSVLEMLISLSERWNSELASDLDMDKSNEYFWKMINNLGLKNCTDDNFNPETVNKKLDILLDREYSRNGKGGLFPLTNVESDVRKIEIWYQLQLYLMENYDF